MDEEKGRNRVISRRGFVIGTATTLAVLTGGFTVMSIMGQPIKTIKNLSLDYDLDEEIRESLYYASLAPSSHNAQMWNVGISPDENTMYVHVDRTRELNHVDPANREALISIGAFLKNLEISLEAYGYSTKINILSEVDEEGLVAEISYTKDPMKEIDLSVLDLIEKRHADKSAFDTSPLSGSITTSLNTIGDSIHYYPNSDEQGDYLARATLEAMKIQSSAQCKRDELSEWLRFSDAEASEKKDGLSAEQLGITGIKKTFYYLFMNRESARGDSYAQQGVDMCKGQVENCSGFFVITGNSDVSSLVQVGMTLQEFWLEATSAGVSIHPMSQALEEEPYASEVKVQLDLDVQPQMILRAGYVPEYGKNAGIRRDLNKFVHLA